MTGSEGADVATWLNGYRDIAEHWQLYGGAGYLYAATGRVLASLQRNHAGFGHAGLRWDVLDWMGLKLQTDAYTALYDSDLDFLGDSIQLTAGGSLRLSPAARLEPGVGENMLVGASPDVTLHGALHIDF